MPLSSALSQLLSGSAFTDTMDNLAEMCPTKLLHIFLFCTINHTQSCRKGIFPQWLLEVVMTWDRTCHPQMRELALAL